MSWHWLVAPGSAIYLIPLTLFAGLALLARARDARRPVLTWWGAVAGACVLAAASKISFYGWGTGIRSWNLTCLSGHTVMAFATWPVLGMLLVPPRCEPYRAAGFLAGVVMASLIAYSRIPLGAHPPSEVIAGAMVGAPAGAFGAWALRSQALPASFSALWLLIALMGALFPRTLAPKLPTERWLASVAVALSGRDEPVTRKRWNRVTKITISRDLHLR